MTKAELQSFNILTFNTLQAHHQSLALDKAVFIRYTSDEII